MKTLPSVTNELRDYKHTPEALDLKSLRQPENTKRTSKSEFRLFAQFLFPLICSGDAHGPYCRLANFLTNVNENNFSRG